MNRHGSFLVVPRTTRTTTYERNASDPRLTEEQALEVDRYGAVLRTLSVAYGRMGPTPHAEQRASHMVLQQAEVAHEDGAADHYRLSVPVTARSHEVTGLVGGAPLDAAAPPSFEAFLAHVDAAADLPPTGTPDGVTPQRRLLTHEQTLYHADDLSGPLPLGQVGARALVYETRTQAFTRAHLEGVFAGKLPDLGVLESEGAYRRVGDDFFVPSARAVPDPVRFYQPAAVIDPFGHTYALEYDSGAHFVTATTDPLGQRVEVEMDYRALAPRRRTDENGNVSLAAYDALGRLTRVALEGKAGENIGDTLDAPTVEHTYDLGRYEATGEPAVVHTRARERHGHVQASAPFQESYTYSDGLGRVLMVKVPAEPGLAPLRDADGQLVLDPDGEVILADTTPSRRWVGTGRTVRDSRGNVVKQYEPYFSSVPDYEDEAELVERGTSPVLTYDPLGRLVHVAHPDGTFARVEPGAWEQRTYDRNDTATASAWYAERIDYAGSDPDLLAERRAAQLTEAHADTPLTVVTDSLGRVFLTIADNGADQLYETRVELDVQGNPLRVLDARGNEAEARTFGMLGQTLEVRSVDAGDRQGLADAGGGLLRAFDARGQAFRVVHDALRRPVERLVSQGGAERLLDRVVYGDALPDPAAGNHAGRVFRVYDGAGVVTTPAYDFKGNPLGAERRLPADPESRPDWSVLVGQGTVADLQAAAAPLLEPEVFVTAQSFDALDRVESETAPDGAVVRYAYGAGGLLESVEVQHAGGGATETVVTNIDYDEKGRRLAVDHGNGTTTAYTYDPLTTRLKRIRTVRA
ncbi:toxin TcdB middle/C-terminal domain-containing protein, partial [Oceanithermus profundus]